MKFSRKSIFLFGAAAFFIVIIILAVRQYNIRGQSLSAPTISFNKYSNILSWDSISHADYYIVKISGTANGTVEVETTKTSYNCSKHITTDTSRDYKFYVKAVTYDSKYSESKWSRGIYYSLFVT